MMFSFMYWLEMRGSVVRENFIDLRVLRGIRFVWGGGMREETL